MISQHVTSLATSKRLKELGVNTPAIHYWVDGEIWDQTMRSDYETPRTPDVLEWIPAYMASELIEKIPRGFWSGKDADNAMVCWNQHFIRLKTDIEFKSENLCDAIALMLIHLIDNNKIITL